MKNLLKILLLLSVLNGFFARGNFIFEYNIKDLFRILMFILMFLCILLMSKSFKIKYIDIIIISNIFILCIVQYREELITAIFIILFIKLYDEYNQRSFEKTLNIGNIISIVMVFIFLNLGLTISEVWIHSSTGSFISNNFEDMFKDFGDARVRYTFGMNHPNSFVGFIISLITFVYLRFKTKISFVINAVLVIFTLYFTDTKSILIYLLSLYFIQIIVKQFYLRGLKYIPIILTIVTFILPLYFTNSYLNEFLSSRLYLWNEYLKSVDFKELFIGKPLDGFIVDNSYIQLIFGTGIVFYIFFCIKSINAIKFNLEERNILVTSFIIAYLIYNFVEAYLLRFENGATILFWYYILKSKNKLHEKENKN